MQRALDPSGTLGQPIQAIADHSPPPEYEQVAAAFLVGFDNPNTRNNYTRSLRVWFQWCIDRQWDPLHDVERHEIEFWMRHLAEIQGKAPRTIVHHLNALAGYYRTAERDGHITKDPMRWVKRPKIQRKSTTNYLTAPELARMIDLASKKRVRDEAILCLLGYNGMRVSEVVGIDIEHLGRDKGFVLVQITRKGGNVQLLPLAQRTAWAVERLIEGRTTGPLFESLRQPGKRIGRGDVQRMVKSYAAKAGVNKRVSPHSLRHSFVTLSLDAGVPERDVQRSTGHTDPRMVAYYDHGNANMASDATFKMAAHVEGHI